MKEIFLNPLLKEGDWFSSKIDKVAYSSLSLLNNNIDQNGVE